MDTAARLLRVLSLLQTRPAWTSEELALRLGVTARTVRRDVTRLRSLGYPVDAEPGPFGGYHLGVGGGALPPLVLDDDEAVAVAIGLRAATSGVAGVEDAALAALAKLEQVLPARLSERVGALQAATVRLAGAPDLPVEAELLVTLAQAARRSQQVDVDYERADGARRVRALEPYRLVRTDRRWYLVARDPAQGEWRTYRVDRIHGARSAPARFNRVDPPDAAALVAEGMAVAPYAIQAEVRLHVPAAEAHRYISPTAAVLERDEGESCVVRIGGDDVAWLVHALAGVACRWEALAPDELRAGVRTLGERLARDHA
jgi:predicted DNA-binding transcriptional regulator YafY